MECAGMLGIYVWKKKDNKKHLFTVYITIYGTFALYCIICFDSCIEMNFVFLWQIPKREKF